MVKYEHSRVYTDREILKQEIQCIKRQNGGICDNKRDCAGCDLCMADTEIIRALNDGIAALEKQIPKKVIKTTENDREFIDFRCSYCKVILQQAHKQGLQAKRATIYKYKHCPDCGQALDWSDE